MKVTSHAGKEDSEYSVAARCKAIWIQVFRGRKAGGRASDYLITSAILQALTTLVSPFAQLLGLKPRRCAKHDCITARAVKQGGSVTFTDPQLQV